MLIKTNKLFSIIVNFWFIYNLLLVIISNFPHWSIPFTSWLNHSFYFLLFLMTAAIAVKEKYSREIFVLLSMLFLLFALGIFHSFTGDDFSFGDNYLSYYLLTYRKVVFTFMVLLTITQITLRYILKNQSKYFVLAQSFVTSAGITFVIFHNFILNKNYILYPEVGKTALYFRVFVINIIMLGWIIIYCISRYKQHRPNGEILGLFIAAFFLYVVIDVGDSYFRYLGRQNIQMSQIILIVNLFIFVLVMLRKLIHLYSPFGNYYERLVLSKLNLVDVSNFGAVESKRNFWSTTASYILNKNYISPIKLFFVAFLANILNLPLYLKINIFMIIFCMLTLIVFKQSLHKRRIKNEGYLP